MPSNLQSATITSSPYSVLPNLTYTSYKTTRSFPVLNNVLHDGSILQSVIQDGVNAPTSFKGWQLSARLTESQLSTLRTFYQKQNGTQGCFYWYDSAELVAQGASYDSTGDSVFGRYTVRFANASWTEVFDLGRYPVSFGLTEIS